MQLEIAIECSTRAASVAARGGGRLLEAGLSSTRAHASDLVPALERLLGELGGEPAGITHVFVGLGPGSYTGLRVGIASALGIARARGARLFGVSSFEVLAWERLAPGERAGILLDGRGGGFYHARYRRLEDELEVLLPPAILPTGEAHARAAEDGRTFTAEDVPSARALLELAAARVARLGPMRPQDVQPLYLRPFQATQRSR